MESTMLKHQLYRTKLCVMNSRGCCNNGERCTYAHVASDIRSVPDLRYTKLCNTVLKGGTCKRKSCTFAHDGIDVRTNQFECYKTSFCNFYSKGKCLNGASCCFAHGIAELRRSLLPKSKLNGEGKAKVKKKSERLKKNRNKNGMLPNGLFSTFNQSEAICRGIGYTEGSFSPSEIVEMKTFIDTNDDSVGSNRSNHWHSMTSISNGLNQVDTTVCTPQNSCEEAIKLISDVESDDFEFSERQKAYSVYTELTVRDRNRFATPFLNSDKKPQSKAFGRDQNMSGVAPSICNEVKQPNLPCLNTQREPQCLHEVLKDAAFDSGIPVVMDGGYDPYANARPTTAYGGYAPALSGDTFWAYVPESKNGCNAYPTPLLYSNLSYPYIAYSSGTHYNRVSYASSAMVSPIINDGNSPHIVLYPYPVIDGRLWSYPHTFYPPFHAM